MLAAETTHVRVMSVVQPRHTAVTFPGLHFRQCVVQVEFHGIAYTITTVVPEGGSLTVEVEHQSEASRWRGDFTAQCNLHAAHAYAQQLTCAVRL